MRRLSDLGDKLITVDNYQAATPDPMFVEVEQELQRLAKDIEASAGAHAK